MTSIRGPRSALTDFIEENNIKIQKGDQSCHKIKSEQQRGRQNDNKDTIQKKKNKRVKKQMPVELINLENVYKSKKDIEVEAILDTLLDIDHLSDEILHDISSYMSRKRIKNQDYIDKIISLSSDRLVIYDCSGICDERFEISKKLKILELYQCGQLTSTTLNRILREQDELEVLRLTGGYLLITIDLPKNLRILDLTNCSRLDDEIIREINTKCKYLEELRLSFCYKITGAIQLSIPVGRLFLCETVIREEFLLNVPKIEQVKALSLKRCQYINNLQIQFEAIEYLDIEGITKIESLSVGTCLKVLNCKQCFRLAAKLPYLLSQLSRLEMLNLSYLPFRFKDISHLKYLNELDVSWCPLMTNDLALEILDNLSLKKLFVFGCFKLSPTISEGSWNNKNITKVLGNPAETKFLILND